MVTHGDRKMSPCVTFLLVFLALPLHRQLQNEVGGVFMFNQRRKRMNLHVSKLASDSVASLAIPPLNEKSRQFKGKYA